jgi:hypothetical protein
MSRGAYLAGRYGSGSQTKRPRSGPAGSPTREQKAFDAGRKDRDRAKQKQETKTTPRKETKTFMQTIMGGGKGGDPDVKKEDFQAPGKHKARAFRDYMVAKYGEGWLDTTQGQDSTRQLRDIAASKGGGRGLLDENILDKIPEVRNKYFPNDPKDITVDMLKTKNFPVADVRDQPELGRYGPLTSDEYFKFTQMLEDRYPEKFRRARPFASGALPELATKFIMSPVSTMAGGIYESLTGKKFGKQELDPIWRPIPLDPKLFYDLDNIEQSGLMGTQVARDTQQDYDYDDPNDPETDPPPGYDSWGDFYAASGIVEGTGGFGTDGQYYFNYADGGLAGLKNDKFNVAEADSLMFKDPVENDEWEYNV